MRTMIFAAMATLLLMPPSLAQGGNGLPAPIVSNDISALPKPVQRKRQRILEAAATGDIEKLRAVFANQAYPPGVSYGVPDDAVDFLREVSADGEGRAILAILIDILSLPYAYYPGHVDQMGYEWPYLASFTAEDLTPAQIVDAYRVLSQDDWETFEEFGGWIFWRTTITAEGDWLSFIAGD